MPRYIDADKIPFRFYAGDELMARKDVIDAMPTVSLDEVCGVVHCGECKFWRRPPSCEGLARCETGETGIRYRTKNDFCSCGMKMEVGEND